MNMSRKNIAITILAVMVIIFIYSQVGLFHPPDTILVELTEHSLRDLSNRESFVLLFTITLENHGAAGEVVLGVDIFDFETREKLETIRKTVTLGEKESTQVELEAYFPRDRNIYYSDPYIIGQTTKQN